MWSRPLSPNGDPSLNRSPFRNCKLICNAYDMTKNAKKKHFLAIGDRETAFRRPRTAFQQEYLTLGAHNGTILSTTEPSFIVFRTH